jgi:alpha-tubulin suppressor-like RCC1 family protein
VSTGDGYTCGVTLEDRAYCWGANIYGRLGDGTVETDRLTPVAVAGGLRFRMVHAGGLHTCGLTTDDRAYCWGLNLDGQLGDGTTAYYRLTPTAVAGGRRFRLLRVGYEHSCAVTPFDVTYCWGSNLDGQLGDGTTTDRLKPVRVVGGLEFKQLSGGNYHTCGVTTAERAYCWGFNAQGQVGDGTTMQRLRPTLVAGGLRFRQVSGGGLHTCGLTLENRAHCWGLNADGQLGDGTTTTYRLTPVLVVGGLRFDHLSAGNYGTCGVTTVNQPYCWGRNSDGEVGDGTTTSRLRPTAVGGGRRFSGIWGGDGHACGVTSEDRAYCWGENSSGQVGDGTTIQRLTPTLVAGRLP